MNMQELDRNDGSRTVKVWDRSIRFFHWTLVLGFATAFISGKFHAPTLHALVGYVLCALIVARAYWGFRGGKHARFHSFVFPAGETLTYARSMIKGNPRHYFGHNPAGALMVFALLATIAMTLATGLVTLSVIDFEGPLLFLANEVTDETSYAFRRIHEFLPTAGLMLVALHLLGVLVGSIQHRENLVKAMITGKKALPSIPNQEKSKEH